MYEAATSPNDLEKFFVERANAGDVEGIVALYEPAAVLLAADGRKISGQDQLRTFVAEYLRNGRQLAPSNQAPALCADGIALTSARHSDGTLSVEVARRQADGNWLWVIDRFAV